jgi:hypothetical protein
MSKIIELPRREAHMKDMQRTTDFHYPIAGARLQEAARIVNGATALHAAVNVLDAYAATRAFLRAGEFASPWPPSRLDDLLVDILLYKTSAAATLVAFADTLVPFSDEHLAVLMAVKSTRNISGMLSSQCIRDLLSLLKSQYNFVLIDTPPVLPLSEMQFFEEVVDGILLVVRAEHTPKSALRQSIEALEAVVKPYRRSAEELAKPCSWGHTPTHLMIRCGGINHEHRV